MNIGIALIAAALVGAGLVLQQQSAEQAPKSYFLHLRLIRELLHQRRWLAGIGIMAAGQALSIWAIGHLELSIAEPLLATSLIFALLLAVPLTGQRLQRSELLGAVLLAGGVAALSVSRSVNSEGMRFGSSEYWPAAGAIALIALCFVRAGWRRSGQWRATFTGAASGLVFGISDALTRQTVETASGHSFVAVLTSWPVYSLVAASILGLWLMESSFNAGPLNASLPAITAAEPVAGIALGVMVFGDVIRISPAMLALQSAGFAALVIGVVLVARAPVLSSLRAAHPSLPHPTLPHPALPRRELPQAARSALAELAPLRGALSRPLLSRPLLSRPVLSRPVLSRPVLSRPVLNRPVLNRPVLSRPLLNRPILSRPLLARPILNRPLLTWPLLSRPILSRPLLDRPLLDRPILARPALARPVLSGQLLTGPVTAAPPQTAPQAPEV
jgi:drug/metabolite transporter (DMT)-like permease